MSKLRVAIIFGGRSTEHEVSVTSATTVLKGLDPARYTPVLIGIDHEGIWHTAETRAELLPEAVFSSRQSVRATPVLGRPGGLGLRDSEGRDALEAPIDVIFPIVHGRGGEDGVLQGLLEMAALPYVGASVASTALCMDKTLSKRVLRDAGLPVVPSLEIRRHDLAGRCDALLEAVRRELGLPVFVKPTNTGSSVGVSKARTLDELRVGLEDAGRYDFDIIVERALDVREIECAVLGGYDPRPSLLGEIVAAGEFYDYEAKYVSDDTQLLIPADLPEARSDQMRAMAVEAFRVLKCWGMARVDFFLERRGEGLFINELNTHPGFTDGSMYPRLWEATGIALPELVDRLVELAQERHHEQSQLEIRFRS